jgi:3-deoxy-D-manno-octulosonate 8-phosphate phosphatase (KDO 8-P phosphatase)
MALIHEKMQKLKAFVLDVDGVLTDGKVILTDQGEQLRTMSVRDGYAIKKAQKEGLIVAVISGGSGMGVLKRLEFLGIQHIFLSVKNKLPVFEQFLKDMQLKAEEVAYMGDDLPDTGVLKNCGFPCCPADAVEEVQQCSVYISPVNGGNGCVRDLIEKTLKLQGKWPVCENNTSAD